jgi:hypothetical protein
VAAALWYRLVEQPFLRAIRSRRQPKPAAWPAAAPAAAMASMPTADATLDAVDRRPPLKSP